MSPDHDSLLIWRALLLQPYHLDRAGEPLELARAERYRWQAHVGDQRLWGDDLTGPGLADHPCGQIHHRAEHVSVTQHDRSRSQPRPYRRQSRVLAHCPHELEGDAATEFRVGCRVK